MGILTFIIPFLLFVLLEKINYKKWTLTSLTFLLFFFIIVYSYILWFSSGIYKDITGLVKLSFLLFYKYSASLAILSIATIYILNDRITVFKSKKNSNIKEQISETKTQEITIYSENKKDNLTIHIDELVYASVSSNYTSVFLNTKNGIKEMVLRITLSKIFIQINSHPQFFRCHKSYMINTSFFDSLKGNTRRYYLESTLLTTQIPVSRSFKKEELLKIIG
ncbi:LytTR family DNA-binding domain-containing protein [Polaribacter sp. Q13]|uniref:LytTR family DNA-binding domain-containing protein n=1 Tax=Polaribacter sp. Q13 TaxID=2806551 RepID=UPI00193B5747|nr:LytTR family DNA-binding domain-containing protein [Polaribacter sp. Q13]QVY64518.1 LytTR family transcriptional regulator [Polaribacter sp. Q13]